MKVKLLIAGVGSIGTRHLRNLLALGYRDIAVCEPSEATLAAVSRLGNFRRYTDLRKALKAERPNIVFVCNPTHLHVPTASLALDFGAHVFIEKPISHTITGIDGLIKKAKKKKRVVMVACNFRFHSGFSKLETILRQQTFGTSLLARVALGYYLPTARKGTSYKTTYAAGTKGGGVVLDSGSHVVDYLTVLFGKVQSVVALKSSLRTIGIQSEEAAVLILKHKSGVLSSVTLDYVSKKPIHIVEITTERGILALDFRGDIVSFISGAGQKTLYRGDGDLDIMFREELKHFMKCVKSGSKPKQSIVMAKETLRTLLIASA